LGVTTKHSVMTSSAKSFGYEFVFTQFVLLFLLLFIIIIIFFVTTRDNANVYL